MPTRTSHVWKNKFVSHQPSFSSYYFHAMAMAIELVNAKKGLGMIKVSSLRIEVWCIIDVMHMDINVQVINACIDLLSSMIGRFHLLLQEM